MDVLLSILGLLGVVAVTGGTAVFVAAEFSLTTLERSQIDAHVGDVGDKRAHTVQRAHRNLSFQLSGAQLGITVTTLITGYLAQPAIATLISPVLEDVGLPTAAAAGVAAVTALILATALSMTFGELVPKNLAIARPLGTARWSAPLQAAFSKGLSWFISGLNGAANWIVRRLGVEPAEELRSARSPQELGSLLATSAQEGTLDEGTASVMARSLRVGERTADELMTPRVRVESLGQDDTVDDLIAATVRTGFSRFPVVDRDLDDIRGVVHVKQAFAEPRERRGGVRLRNVMRTATTVPDSLDGDELLDRLRGAGLQMALVVDEYGGTAGIVTLEDLVEEIVGDVRDEHDQGEDARVRDGGEDTWIVSGMLRPDELADVVGWSFPSSEVYETLAGYILSELQRLAWVGDAVTVDDWQLIVTRVDRRRVSEVRVVRPPAVAPTAVAVDEASVGTTRECLVSDYLALLAMLALLLGNAFFVGAEFSLISARRDRVEALVEEGVSGASTVLRASEHLSLMLAASQLGITICSLALGSLGEPAVAHQLELVLEPLGVPQIVIGPLSFVVALVIVTILHIVIGEMVPKNIAIAGPERTSLWLVPPLVLFLKVTKPVIGALNWVANHFLRLFGVVPVDEREAAFTPTEIADMVSESRREGLLDDAQSRRLSQTLSSAEKTVADVLVPLERVTALPPHPTVGAVEEAVARTGFSRFPVQAPAAPDSHPRLDADPLAPGTEPVLPENAPDGAPLTEMTGYLHVKDVLDLSRGADVDTAVVPSERVRTLPRLASTAPVEEALAVLRREGSHLARAVDGDGTTVGVVALEDLVEEYVGTVRDSTHVGRSNATITRQRPT